MKLNVIAMIVFLALLAVIATPEYLRKQRMTAEREFQKAFREDTAEHTSRFSCVAERLNDDALGALALLHTGAKPLVAYTAAMKLPVCPAPFSIENLLAGVGSCRPADREEVLLLIGPRDEGFGIVRSWVNAPPALNVLSAVRLASAECGIDADFADQRYGNTSSSGVQILLRDLTDSSPAFQSVLDHVLRESAALEEEHAELVRKRAETALTKSRSDLERQFLRQ